jgi:hypothetical protein
MMNKKVLFLCLVVLVCSVMIVGCGGGSGKTTTPPATTTDPTTTLDMDHALVVGDNFTGVSSDTKPLENYYGPWGSDNTWSLSGGAIEFDCGVSNGWLTLNNQVDPSPANKYRYVVISIKADSPITAIDAALTVGDKAQTLNEWGIKDLSSTDYKTYVIDLTTSGFTAWGDSSEPNYKPDFALNQSGAKTGKLYIGYIKLANAK